MGHSHMAVVIRANIPNNRGKHLNNYGGTYICILHCTIVIDVATTNVINEVLEDIRCTDDLRKV
jgi:hypothetical protein